MTPTSAVYMSWTEHLRYISYTNTPRDSALGKAKISTYQKPPPGVISNGRPGEREQITCPRSCWAIWLV